MMKTRVLLLLLLAAVPVFMPAAEDRFSFSADRTEAILSQGKERTILSGRAEVTTGGTRISADRIELYGKDFRFVLCSGAVTVLDEEQGFILNCRDLFFDRETELARVQGYSEMLDQKQNMVVKGSFLENRGKENITVVQIGVRILREDDEGTMVCRAEYARYDRDAEQLELSGTPRITWKGDDYAATRISVNLNTDEIVLEGKVSGTVTPEEEE